VLVDVVPEDPGKEEAEIAEAPQHRRSLLGRDQLHQLRQVEGAEVAETAASPAAPGTKPDRLHGDSRVGGEKVGEEEAAVPRVEPFAGPGDVEHRHALAQPDALAEEAGAGQVLAQALEQDREAEEGRPDDQGLPRVVAS
jgi:hypothetical protein